MARARLERHNEIVRPSSLAFGALSSTPRATASSPASTGPARAIALRARRSSSGVAELGLEVRAGIHTGECERVGEQGRRAGRERSGARVSGVAGAGEVLVSQTVKDLVAGSGIEFEDRGTHELKGVPGEWRLFAVSPS